MYIRAKLKECIFRQKRSVYIRVNPFHLKLQNFAFCESCSSNKGGERWKSDPSVKSPNFFEGGGGDRVDKYGKIISHYVKTQWKVVSDFTGKKGTFPPCDPLLFLGKKFFFGFSEKFSKFFFNEIDCKKFSNFFYNEVSSKKFFNSLKMTTKNFRNFFQ